MGFGKKKKKQRDDFFDEQGSSMRPGHCANCHRRCRGNVCKSPHCMRVIVSRCS